MVQRATKFTQADVARVFKAAKSAGETVRVEIHPDGRLVATPLSKREVPASENEWDALK
jgi:hypothetical protein